MEPHENLICWSDSHAFVQFLKTFVFINLLNLYQKVQPAVVQACHASRRPLLSAVCSGLLAWVLWLVCL